MARKDTIISFRNLRTELGGLVVHKSIDLDIVEGETISILGPSGCGKSVLLKVLIGLLPATSGEVWFEGKDLTQLSEREMTFVRRDMNMLFQGGALFDAQTVFDNIAYPLREQHLAEEKDIPEIVTEKLRLVGLPGVEEMMPAELSGGMKKRVALARAIATEPKVLLYDEPTTGLDPTNIRRINELIRSLQEKIGVTSLVVTHELPTVFGACDRAALIWGGEIAAVGAPNELRDHGPEIVRRFIEGTAPV